MTKTRISVRSARVRLALWVYKLSAHIMPKVPKATLREMHEHPDPDFWEDENNWGEKPI